MNFDSNYVTVEESFLDFLVVDDIPTKRLFEVISKELESLGPAIDDLCGKGYDNEANMKGQHNGFKGDS